MAYNPGSVAGSVRYYFYTEAEAWEQARRFVSYGRRVVAYGVDRTRKITQFYIDVA